MTGIVERFNSPEELLNDAADDFLRMLAKHPYPHFDVAFLGGQTAVRFFDALKRASIAQSLWQKVRFFVSDERAVPLFSEQSNGGNLIRNLLRPLSINEHQFFPCFDENKGAQQSAHEYEKLFGSLLKHQDGTPVFDLVYLGLGADGHTASLFPHDELVKNLLDGYEPRLVADTKPEHCKEERLTFCPRLINRAAKVVFLAYGADKRATIENILRGDLNELLWPAQLVFRHRTKDTLFMCA